MSEPLPRWSFLRSQWQQKHEFGCALLLGSLEFVVESISPFCCGCFCPSNVFSEDRIRQESLGSKARAYLKKDFVSSMRLCWESCQHHVYNVCLALQTLMPHQILGAQFVIWQEWTKQHGGMLADEPGLGKTLVCALPTFLERSKPAILISSSTVPHKASPMRQQAPDDPFCDAADLSLRPLHLQGCKGTARRVGTVEQARSQRCWQQR